MTGVIHPLIFLFYCRYLLDTISFLDETRVGIWGWGYGGYVTSMVLGTQQDVFKCGIAISPIADWLYYSKYYAKKRTRPIDANVFCLQILPLQNGY